MDVCLGWSVIAPGFSVNIRVMKVTKLVTIEKIRYTRVWVITVEGQGVRGYEARDNKIRSKVVFSDRRS